MLPRVGRGGAWHGEALSVWIMRNIISRWAASGAIAGFPPPAAGPSAAPAPPLPSPPRTPQSARATAALAAGMGGRQDTEGVCKAPGHNTGTAGSWLPTRIHPNLRQKPLSSSSLLHYASREPC